MTEQAIQTVEETGRDMATPEHKPQTMMDMLGVAVQNNYDPETISKFLDQIERVEKREAKQAYERAMSSFKQDMPRVSKNAQNNHLHNKYATLDHVLNTLSPIMAEHGLRVSWDSEPVDKYLMVTCRVTHRSGHFEETRFPSEITPPNKGQNAAQAMAVAKTYGERYTLMAALGIAATDDTDGNTGKAQTRITQGQIDDLQAACDAAGMSAKDACQTMAEYWRIEINSLADIPPEKFGAVMQKLKAKAGNKGARDENS